MGCSESFAAPESLLGDDEDFPFSDEDEDLASTPASLLPIVHCSPTFDDQHDRHGISARPTYPDPNHPRSPLAKAFSAPWDAPRTPVPSTPREGRFCLPRVPTPQSSSRVWARPAARDVSSNIPSLPVFTRVDEWPSASTPGRRPRYLCSPLPVHLLVLLQALVRPAPVRTRPAQHAAPPSLTCLSPIPRTDRYAHAGRPTSVPAGLLLSPTSLWWRVQVLLAADVLPRDSQRLVSGAIAAPPRILGLHTCVFAMRRAPSPASRPRRACCPAVMFVPGSP